MKQFFKEVNEIFLNLLTEETNEIKTPKQKEKKKNLKSKFPLQKGDIVLMYSGERYLVQEFRIRGFYSIKECSLVLYDASKTTHSFKKKMSFSSLRELNYYAKENRDQIKDVICKGSRVREPSKDECHKEAFIIEHAREELKHLFPKDS